MLSIYDDISRIGNLEQAIHILRDLKLHPKRKLDFDLVHPDINDNNFQDFDLAEFIGMPVKRSQGTSHTLDIIA